MCIRDSKNTPSGYNAAPQMRHDYNPAYEYKANYSSGYYKAPKKGRKGKGGRYGNGYSYGYPGYIGADAGGGGGGGGGCDGGGGGGASGCGGGGGGGGGGGSSGCGGGGGGC
ncbi:hypothetical protein BDV18DRAFT_157627 [Aspergillus unguis]